MDETVADVAAAYRRRATRDAAVVASALLGGCLLVALVAPLAVAAATALAATVGLYAPVFRPTTTVALADERSPSAVRAALAGEDCPFLAIERGWADGVERVDGGWELDYTTLGVFRRDVRYEAATDDGTVRVEVSVNDAPTATYEAVVKAADGGTRVRATRQRPSRVGLRTVLFERARRGYDRRAYAALGYEVGPDPDGAPA
jgi:hypothetical protein